MQDEKQVRKMISTPQGTIEIYEPTMATIDKVIDMQRDQDFGEDTGVISFEASVVIKVLFPLLTNIDMADLTDEEITEIAENPSIHLLMAQQEVSQIISEANTLYMQRVKTELLSVENTMASVELMDALPSIILQHAKEGGRTHELMENVKTAQRQLEEAEEAERVLDMEENEKTSTEE